MDLRIKSTYMLGGDTVDLIDKRSEETFSKKSSIVDSDLNAYWSLLEYSAADARSAFSARELSFLVKVLHGRKIDGREIIVWASEWLAGSIRNAFRSFAKAETVGVDCDRILNKIEALSMLERVALCDWAAKEWGMPSKMKTAGESFDGD